MNQFKHILLSLHGENKSLLRRLYVDRQVYVSSLSSSEQPVEDEKIYNYNELWFRFAGTGMRHPERLNIFVHIPKCIVNMDSEYQVPCEDFLLRSISPRILRLAEELANDRKDTREKAAFETQQTNECIVRRSGMLYLAEKESYVLRILFYMPLINGISINAKSGFRAVRSILETIEEAIKGLDYEAFSRQVRTYGYQEQIREWLAANHCVAFVADGSILPRGAGGHKDAGMSGGVASPKGAGQLESVGPLEGAVPFRSPKGLRRTIRFDDGGGISGMAIPEGVTVITGGGYSGKSTLLNALEEGIYHHICGDGREFVISVPESVKIYAEDGRVVHRTDMSMFFQNGVTGNDFTQFETQNASGSVSQAANILEAMYAGGRLLLIDEDTSAANFMIRDNTIRRLVQKEPIIPFTDRVRSLYGQAGISTLLVIGGSGEYMCHADLCLMMEDYIVRDVTAAAREMSRTVEACDVPYDERQLIVSRRFCPQDYKTDCRMDFYVSKYVSVDRARYIQIDNFCADVTRITALKSENQLRTLTYLLEQCFMLEAENGKGYEYNELSERLVAELFGAKTADKVQTENYKFALWFEEIRPMDLVAAIFRLRRLG